MYSGMFAKSVIASSALTLLIAGGVLFLMREPIAMWLIAQSTAKVSEVAPISIETTEDLIVETIAAVNPAVVSVVITKDVPVYERYYENSSFGSWFGFGGFAVPRIRENGTEEREVGGGSGFIVSADGLMVTNRHVVDDDEARYSVVLTDGQTFETEVVARDPFLDIAVLQIKDAPAHLPYVEFGDVSDIRLGQTVIAIGNALAEFNNSVSVGVISGLSRSVVAGNGMGMSEQLDEVIQTDAAINPGNSGGPLLNSTGKVIGMNVAASIGAENIGFALPANVVQQVVDSVVQYGEIVRPFLGVRYVSVNERMQELNDLPVSYGALIVPGRTADELAVQPGSPAARAGLQANDIILAVDGTRLQDTTLARVLRNKRVGQSITLTVWRNGAEQTFTAVLDKSD